MDQFRFVFEEWVRSIDINGIETDLYIPKTAKYLTFNYTETFEKGYGIPKQNVLHIHGSRLIPSDEFVLGHGNHRDEEAPLLDESILLPYQNAYSSVIRIMNEWKKSPKSLIEKNMAFFKSLSTCKGVCVMGFLQEYHKATENGLDSRFDRVRRYARYGYGDLPVWHLQSRVLLLGGNLSTPELIFSGNVLEEIDAYGFYPMYLWGFWFYLEVTPRADLTREIYLHKQVKDMNVGGFVFKNMVELKNIEQIDFTLRQLYGNK